MYIFFLLFDGGPMNEVSVLKFSLYVVPKVRVYRMYKIEVCITTNVRPPTISCIPSTYGTIFFKTKRFSRRNKRRELTVYLSTMYPSIHLSIYLSLSLYSVIDPGSDRIF